MSNNMIVEEEIDSSICCVKTHCLRIDRCSRQTSPVYNEERESRILVHQERVQNELNSDN
ncbi:hypothetical protein LCGC14_0849240 [marine sediment metagenome]|uniref:Uncharacterized protein n=1 Tax=marine sediment metagenome TaxID=412755 RepID=A0A0F9RVL1_9ZZZZ